METATLTKNEEAHVGRMSEPFSEPSMQENFESWAARSISHSKGEKREREKNSGAREIKLEGRPSVEREWIEKVAQKDESEKKAPANSSAEKDAAKPAEHPNTKESEKPDAKAAERPAEKPAASESDADSPSEPLSSDLAERHWQGKLQGEEVEAHINQVNGRIRVVLDFLSSHPQKAQMEQGFRAIFAGRPPAQANALFRDLAACLAEVPNREQVFRHITLQSQDREALRQCKNAQELRAAIRTISQHYPAASPQASAKPRAPKPPSEVGGRGAAGDDGTRGETSFSSFSARQSQIYGR